ncbi:single-stranded DNA-binding protein [Opitutales bacterium ASA1]|jgi:single-strand DNA-binding protein|uniref:single-stranded DNA-binding protein n=1 Tax=Congregicoccus parvus TaxID=3081749 RepID=UPI002B2FBDE0|nr:single-stranded DNA-binding protein [Opitutales bacterium ASA1]
MASFNKVILMGNLTRDPELRVTPKGTAVCQIGLAVNQTYRDKDGNSREETTFIDVDAFGRQAEVIAKYLTKGRPVLIEGRLKLDSWESKEGEKRSKLKVVMENFQFVGGRGENEAGASSGGYEDSAPAPRAPQRSQSAPPKSSRAADVDEEDVPF